MIKYIVLFIIIACTLFYCTSLPTSIDLSKEKSFLLENSDKCKIIIYKECSNSNNSSEYIFGKYDIPKIISFISDQSTGGFLKCGFSGEIDFLKDNNSILSERMFFNSECGNIVIKLYNTLYSQKITKEGVAFLMKLSGDKK